MLQPLAVRGLNHVDRVRFQSEDSSLRDDGTGVFGERGKADFLRSR